MNFADRSCAVLSNDHRTTVGATSSQIEVELSALVSQMEAEIAVSGSVTQASAAQLHAIRHKVEAMLTGGVCGSDSYCPQ